MGKVVPIRSYSAKVYSVEQEKRWFYRYVLRRAYRMKLIHAGHLASFTIETDINQVYNSVLVLRDPLEDLRL